MTSDSSVMRRLVGLAAAGLAASALTACGGSGEGAPASTGAATASAQTGAAGETLLDAQALDVLDQAIGYPRKGAAQVSADVRTLEAGQETGWHRHRVPVFVYVLEGTLTVEYDAGVTKEFPAGTAYMEGEDVWHDVTNAGDDPARYLSVFMGAKGAKNSVERSP